MVSNLVVHIEILLLGIYRHSKVRVVDGACPPLLLHTDKSKTKKKQQDERKRQRNGETQWNDLAAPRFLKGLDPGLGINVATTHTGSMTQEIFYMFAEHFVTNLPANHGPVLLLLDGHSS